MCVSISTELPRIKLLLILYDYCFYLLIFKILISIFSTRVILMDVLNYGTTIQLNINYYVLKNHNTADVLH